MVLEKAGARTPQAVLYALEFFATGFGFERCFFSPRTSRLANNYARDARGLVNRAPEIDACVVKLAEQCVCDVGRSLPDRVLMGRFRVSVQATIRHDDLSNTPVAQCEWVRNAESGLVRGLRSVAAQTKTTIRPWVAS